MDYSAIGGSFQGALGVELPRILGALLILIIGWILAVVVRGGVRRLLAAARLNRRIAETTEQKVDVESGISAAAFWLIILITLIGVFNTLDLILAAAGRESGLRSHRLSRGRGCAADTRCVACGGCSARYRQPRARYDRPGRKAIGQCRHAAHAQERRQHALLARDPAVRTRDPQCLRPNIFAAFLIGFVGWLLGKVLAGLVTNILATAGADEGARRLGLDPTLRISQIAGTVVMILVFVPALIAALDALKIEAISRPATDMLGRFLAAVPNLVAAALILMVTYYVARFAAQLLGRLLNAIGFDTLPQKLGLSGVFAGGAEPSRLVSMLVLFFAMLFATVEAANLLEFTQLRDVVTLFIRFGGNVVLGALILVIGAWLANVAHSAIRRADVTHSESLAGIARVAILGLVIAMGLRAMGIADEIVELAFLLTFGAVAIAVALSFGLGGREAAGKQMEYWLAKLRRP